MVQSKRELELLPEYRDVSVVKRPQDYLIDGQKYNRVTTAINIIARGGLDRWAKGITLEKVEEVLLDSRVQEGLAKMLEATSNDGPTDEYRGWVSRLVGSAAYASDRVRDEAAERGTGIHDQIQTYLEHGANWLDRPLTAEAGYALDFLAERQISVERTEMTVWNEALRIAGTCDAIGREPDGSLCIWDWKSSSGPWWQMALQLGAYSTMIEGLTGELPQEAYIVKLRPERYELYRVPDLTDAEDTFILASQVYRASSRKWFQRVEG